MLILITGILCFVKYIDYSLDQKEDKREVRTATRTPAVYAKIF